MLGTLQGSGICTHEAEGLMGEQQIYLIILTNVRLQLWTPYQIQWCSSPLPCTLPKGWTSVQCIWILPMLWCPAQGNEVQVSCGSVAGALPALRALGLNKNERSAKTARLHLSGIIENAACCTDVYPFFFGRAARLVQNPFPDQGGIKPGPPQ